MAGHSLVYAPARGRSTDSGTIAGCRHVGCDLVGTGTGGECRGSACRRNTAGVQTLAANLKGVGESRAAEIVRYRETFGAFDSVEELVEVKGIGSSTLDMNRDVITLE